MTESSVVGSRDCTPYTGSPDEEHIIGIFLSEVNGVVQLIHFRCDLDLNIHFLTFRFEALLVPVLVL